MPIPIFVPFGHLHLSPGAQLLLMLFLSVVVLASGISGYRWLWVNIRDWFGGNDNADDDCNRGR